MRYLLDGRRLRRGVSGCAGLIWAVSLGLAGWLAVGHQAVWAADYFVAVGGSDAGAGSTLAPWRTLQRAAGVVLPGDRVFVRPGDYRGFDIRRSGTLASPIQFLAESGVRITEENGVTADGINLEGASHIVIDGFAVTGMERAGVRAVLGDFVTVRRVHAYDNGRWGIFTGFVDDLVIENNVTSGSILEHGIYVSNSGDRPVLRGNTSFGNHGSGIHMNGDRHQGGDGIISDALVTGNRIFNNAVPVAGMPGGGSGINMDGVQDSRIENNLLYGNRASGISLYSIDGAQGSTGNVVINNTIHQPADGRWAINIRDESTGNTVLNNILVTQHVFRGAISVWDDSLEGLASDRNVLASRFTIDDGGSVLSLTDWQTATGQDLHSRVAGAGELFVDWQRGDYRLKPGAIALDAGTNVAAIAPLADLTGTARPQGAGVDAGALEQTALPADFDGSGIVNAGDLTRWRGGIGAQYNALRGAGDFDSDGDVDGSDFVLWQRMLGATAGGMAAGVPEPSGLVIAAALAARVLGERRRQSASAPLD